MLKPDSHIDVEAIHGGAKARVIVTQIAPNAFRLEESIPFSHDDLAVGDIVIGTLKGNKLYIERRAQRSPLVRSDYILPATVLQSPGFAALKTAILATGGQWEQLFEGLFIVHLPRDSMLDVSYELKRLNEGFHTNE